MKLLALTSNPDRASFRQRIGAYLDMLREKGIEVQIEALDKNIIKRIRQYRTADRYDITFIHKKCFSFIDGLAFRPKKSRVIFNYDDAVMFNDRGRATRTHTIRFQRTLKKADAILTASTYLKNRAGDFQSKVTVLPIGIETASYQALRPPEKGKEIRLVWIGSAATTPYLKALEPVLATVCAKHPEAILRVINDEPVHLNGVRIENFKWEREHRKEWLAECDIGLAPLPDTPFTQGKCSFKVLEYAAAGLPAVASPIGTNSEYIRPGKTGFFAEHPEQWLEKISLFIEDKSLRETMKQNCLAHVRQFDVEKTGEALCSFIEKTASLRKMSNRNIE